MAPGVIANGRQEVQTVAPLNRKTYSQQCFLGVKAIGPDEFVPVLCHNTGGQLAEQPEQPVGAIGHPAGLQRQLDGVGQRG